MSTTHPTLARFTDALEPAYKSNAATMEGKLRSHNLPPNLRGLREYFVEKGMGYEGRARCANDVRINALLPRSKGASDSWHRRKALTLHERDIRRARADKNFRNNYLRRLHRAVKALDLEPNRDIDSVIAWAEDSYRLQSERKALTSRYHKITGKNYPTKRPSTPAWLRKLHINDTTARAAGAKLDMRGDDSSVKPTFGLSWLDYDAPVTEWKSGRPVGYTRAKRDNYVTSFAILREDGKLDIAIAKRRVEGVEAPEGYRWDTDSHGVCLRSNAHGSECHFEARDVISYPDQWIERTVTELEENKIRRDRLKVERKAELAKTKGVHVCFRDSLRGGNCAAGTRQWVNDHNLDERKHYAADTLVDLSNGDYNMVRRALFAAVQRHEKEVEQGVCLLEDHGLKF